MASPIQQFLGRPTRDVAAASAGDASCAADSSGTAAAGVRSNTPGGRLGTKSERFIPQFEKKWLVNWVIPSISGVNPQYIRLYKVVSSPSLTKQGVEDCSTDLERCKTMDMP